jgi:dCMP deaminase
MARATWDEVWLGVADVVATRSACRRDGVGAVVIDARNRLVSSGYNGPPAGLDASACPRELGGPKELCTAIHAEANALLWGDRREREGGTVYVTRVPCRACALLVANSGARRAVYRRTADDAGHASDTLRLLQGAGLDVEVVFTPWMSPIERVRDLEVRLHFVLEHAKLWSEPGDAPQSYTFPDGETFYRDEAPFPPPAGDPGREPGSLATGARGAG